MQWIQIPNLQTYHNFEDMLLLNSILQQGFQDCSQTTLPPRLPPWKTLIWNIKDASPKNGPLGEEINWYGRNKYFYYNLQENVQNIGQINDTRLTLKICGSVLSLSKDSSLSLLWCLIFLWDAQSRRPHLYLYQLHLLKVW